MVGGAAVGAAGVEPLTAGGAEAVQLLSPDGARRTEGRHAALVAHVQGPGLRDAYRDMALVRRIDAEATSLQRQGELALWASCGGQEAAQVGAGRALAPQDHVFPSYRELALAWSRGVDPIDVLRLYRGTTHGGWDPASTGFHLFTLVIGAQALHATGYAMGVQRDGAVGTGDPDRDTCVMACFGDGATSQGEVSEAMGWAAVNHAPVVFFCQNNQWAISAPVARQSRAPIYQRAAGFGFPGVRVDGNDVLAVQAVVAEAAQRARSGEGPTLVEAFTHRTAAHTTSDDPSRYRSRAEEDLWAALDPLARLETHLRAIGAADDGFFADVAAEGKELAARVRRAVRSMADPAPSTMFDHVYAEPHPLVAAERAWLDDWIAAGEEADADAPGGADDAEAAVAGAAAAGAAS